MILPVSGPIGEPLALPSTHSGGIVVGASLEKSDSRSRRIHGSVIIGESCSWIDVHTDEMNCLDATKD